MMQTSAYNFCSNGEQGSGLVISSIVDNLDDNTASWKWDEEQNIKVTAILKNEKEYREDFTVEIVLVDSDGNEVEIIDDGDLSKDITLNSEESDTISFDFQLEDDIPIDDYQLYVKFYVEGQESSFCKQTYVDVDIGALDKCSSHSGSIEITEFADEKLDNEDSWEWETGQDIEVSIYVKNSLPDASYDAYLTFYNEDGDEVEFADEEDLKETQTISNGDTEEITFKFSLNDIPEGNYGMYVNVLNSGDNSICTSRETKGSDELHYIDVYSSGEPEITAVSGSQSLTTGDTSSYSVTIKNNGHSEQDKVLIIAYSKVMGISQEQEIEDLSSGETQTAVFSLAFTNGVTGTYPLLFKVEYGYDDDEEEYTDSISSSYDITINKIPEPAVEPVKNDSTEPTPVAPAETTNTNDGKNQVFIFIFLVCIALGLGGYLLWGFIKDRKTKNAKQI